MARNSDSLFIWRVSGDFSNLLLVVSDPSDWKKIIL